MADRTKPVHLFTVFPMNEHGEVVGESGRRTDEDHLIQVITDAFNNEEVAYCEVHDGSCSPRITE
jgi:hypothetical protein